MKGPGYEDLWRWFGLSYAAWLTLPRVLMHEMPDEWQRDMARLLEQYDDAITSPPDLGTRVSVTRRGRFVRMPGWLGNYRHPDREAIRAVMAGDDSVSTAKPGRSFGHWYCVHCDTEVQPEGVTFEETHDSRNHDGCGGYVEWVKP